MENACNDEQVKEFFKLFHYYWRMMKGNYQKNLQIHDY
jgi:hypothetical protein